MTLVDAGRHHSALYHHPERLPAAAGHRPDHRRDRGRHRRLVRRDAAPHRTTIEAIVRADPDVTGVVSVIGVTPLNATPNAGRLAITLKPRDQRSAHVDRDHRPAEGRGRRHSRHDGLFPGDAGHPDLHPRQPRAVPVHAGRHRCRRGAANGPNKLARQLRGDPALREVASEAQEGGPRVNVDVDREKAGRLGVSMQSDHRHAQRRLRPAADFDHLRPGQPVPRHPGGAAALPAGPRLAVQALCHRRQHLTGTAATVANTTLGSTNTNTTADAQRGHRRTRCRSRAFAHFEHTFGAAGDRASGAVPLRHHQLRSRARLRRCATPSPRSARRRSDIGMPAIGDRQLFRRRRRIRQVAGRRAVADPRRGDRDLHRARRAVRELHPPAHHPLHAALRRRRRAAGADAVRP